MNKNNKNISLIAALSQNHVIGYENKLPWNLPNDLKHFRELTLNKTIVMGRKTLESIGKALPKRKNIVLTRDPNFQFEGVEVLNDFKKILNLQDPEIMIIGGEEIYELFLPYASRLYLTEVNVNTEIPGDAFFPEFNKNHWELVSSESHSKDDLNSYDYVFKTYIKN